MALDGIVIANLVRDMQQKLVNGRISKIAQPESDELLVTVKSGREQLRLLISVNASLPLLYFADSTKQSPMTAPNFCMLLRKHIGSARIVSVTQPGLERIVDLELEHLDELGDVCRKHLIVELMGKHSNIIFCNDEHVIVDSIKHVSAQVSSVREVLPGRPYFIPETVKKYDPLSVTDSAFMEVLSRPLALSKALYTGLTGISPIIAEELCFLASLDADVPAENLDENGRLHLLRTFRYLMEDVQEGRFCPNIRYRAKEPVEFASLPLTCLGSLEEKRFESISEVLKEFYAAKETYTRIRQKSADLRKIVQNALERGVKKYDLQAKQLKDTQKREKYRIYGELLNTYGYSLEENADQLTCMNYYTNEEITVPLDPNLTAKENARKYFDRYAKMKRTYEALSGHIRETQAQIAHLESISASLDMAVLEEDLMQIKLELQEYGYIKKHAQGRKREKVVSRPYHYLSSDGFHMYVGKNNYQNEELTFQTATGNDWWFHAKGIPGSHVIVKSEGKELPDRVFEEAAALAAYYSKGRDASKVEIDYIEKKHVKKTPGGAPGFVIYHTNYSMMAEPSVEHLKQL